MESNDIIRKLEKHSPTVTRFMYVYFTFKGIVIVLKNLHACRIRQKANPTLHANLPPHPCLSLSLPVSEVCW